MIVRRLRASLAVGSVLLSFSASLVYGQRVEVTVSADHPLTGHLIVVFSKDDKAEPRMELEETYESAQGFGVDVDQLEPKQPIVVDATTFGYPRRSPAHDTTA